MRAPRDKTTGAERLREGLLLGCVGLPVFVIRALWALVRYGRTGKDTHN